MMPIEYSKRVVCSYKNYGCHEIACPLNIGHMPKKPFFRIGEIDTNKCLRTLDMIADETINVEIRNWMKAVFVEGKHIPPPLELCKLIQRQAAEMVEPTSTRLLVKNAPLDIDEWLDE